MALTDMALRNAKPKDKPDTPFDGGGPHLLVDPKGSRIWRPAYRFAGQPQHLSFGPHPATSLSAARQKREDAKSSCSTTRTPPPHASANGAPPRSPPRTPSTSSPTISSIGSAMESFFSSPKTAAARRKVYRTSDQARADVFDYIECFYNPNVGTR